MTACMQTRLDAALAQIERLQSRVAELEAVVLPLEELLREHFDAVAINHLRLHWSVTAYWGEDTMGPEALGEGPTLAAALAAAVEAKKGATNGTA